MEPVNLFTATLGNILACLSELFVLSHERKEKKRD